jgi:hypothetical protein
MNRFTGRSKDWLEGYLSACFNFAIWYDGKMVCGVQTKYVDIKKEIEEAIKDIEKEG